MLPKYGKIQCRKCFSKGDNKITKPHDEWRMRNDPGAWGGDQYPEYLVLGFSKGSTQADYYQKGKFEDIAFAGLRPRLTQALQAVGALKSGETLEKKIKDPSSNIAFGSLIRCSVSRRNNQNKYACTGSLITKSFVEIPDVLTNCTNEYLTGLPNSIKTVFFLGNGDPYVKSCQLLIKNLFPNDFMKINPMAVKADNRKWIHLAHPSGSNGHFTKWLDETTGSGLKRILACKAMKSE